MNAKIHDVGESVLVVVDMQSNMMPAIEKADRVTGRAAYLIQCAPLLKVPVLATEQIPSKLGPTVPAIAEAMAGAEAPFPKVGFSCCSSLDFMDALRGTWRKQVVLVGVETHICVVQTALELRAQQFDVTLCMDAVGSRDGERHLSGLRRAEQAGCQIAHTESVAYEWMVGAEHPAFRGVLALTKSAPI